MPGWESLLPSLEQLRHGGGSNHMSSSLGCVLKYLGVTTRMPAASSRGYEIQTHTYLERDTEANVANATAGARDDGHTGAHGPRAALELGNVGGSFGLISPLPVYMLTAPEELKVQAGEHAPQQLQAPAGTVRERGRRDSYGVPPLRPSAQTGVTFPGSGSLGWSHSPILRASIQV